MIKNPALRGGPNGLELVIDCIVIFRFSRRRPSDQLCTVADERAAVQRRSGGTARSWHLIDVKRH